MPGSGTIYRVAASAELQELREEVAALRDEMARLEARLPELVR